MPIRQNEATRKSSETDEKIGAMVERMVGLFRSDASLDATNPHQDRRSDFIHDFYLNGNEIPVLEATLAMQAGMSKKAIGMAAIISFNVDWRTQQLGLSNLQQAHPNANPGVISQLVLMSDMIVDHRNSQHDLQ